jgi:hypothetical protein
MADKLTASIEIVKSAMAMIDFHCEVGVLLTEESVRRRDQHLVEYLALLTIGTVCINKYASIVSEYIFTYFGTSFNFSSLVV